MFISEGTKFKMMHINKNKLYRKLAQTYLFIYSQKVLMLGCAVPLGGRN